MNSCMLMADIIQAPQLRYTSDTQTPIAEFIVKFPGLREDDTPAQIKVIGWGNLAQQIQETYKEGDRVLLEGRLNMNTIERPEGFREKRAELTLQRIHSLNELNSLTLPAGLANPLELNDTVPAPAAPAASNRPAQPAATPAADPYPAEPDYDDIPF